MPSIKRTLKIARLAVQHLGPPLVRGVFSLAGGVVANLVTNSMRSQPGRLGNDQYPLSNVDAPDPWLLATRADMVANRQPDDLDFGTDHLPPHLQRL